MRKGESVPKINIKTREAARAILITNDLEDEYLALLNLPENESEWSDHEENVAFVRDMRMDAALRLIDTEHEIASESGSGLKELKAIRREISQEINAMPASGSTYEEWEELSEDERSTGIGRPPLPIELSLLRARMNREEKMIELRSVEKEVGRPQFSEDQIVEKYRNATENTGRRPINLLGALDRDIRILSVEIEFLKTDDAEVDYQEKVTSAKHSKKGKRYGRPPEPVNEKLERLSLKKAKISEKRAKIELSLGPVEKMERQIKVKRDDIFSLRKNLRNRGIDPEGEAASATDEGVILDKMLSDVERIKGLVEMMKSGSDDKEFLAKQQQKIYEEEASRIKKNNRELRKSARDRLGVGDINELARDIGVTS
jgi:hypothetical protein